MKGKIFLAAKFSVKFFARYNVGFPMLSRCRGEGVNPHPVALSRLLHSVGCVPRWTDRAKWWTVRPAAGS